MTGRVASVSILPRVRHSRLLLGSVLVALFGCLVLFLSDNAFGALSGAFFVGAGYASIYPLVAEAIGRRFPITIPASSTESSLWRWWEAAGAGQRRVCGGGYGRGSGDRDSPGWDLHGDGPGFADFAGIEGDWEMTSRGGALLFAIALPLSAASLRRASINCWQHQQRPGGVLGNPDCGSRQRQDAI